MRKLWSGLLLLGALALVGGGVSACAKAQAETVKVASVESSAGTPTALTVVATYTSGTVTTPTGTIVDSIVWTDSLAGQARSTVRTIVKAATTTADSVAISPRAPLGGTDFVGIKVCSVYRANGNMTCGTGAKAFVNADHQVPSIPVIVSVDTL